MAIYSIYKATSKTTGKSYIGFDSNWPNRKSVHKSNIKHKDYKFYRALKKYGWDDFEWSLVYQSTDRDHTLNEMESYFIKQYDTFTNGYNMTVGGDGSVLSEEIIERIRKANIGKKLSEETKEKLRQINLGKKQSPETKEKNRQSNLGRGLGRKLSDETKDKLRKQNIGKKLSDETKSKISLALKGRPKKVK